MHDLFLSIAKPLNREVVKAGEEREMEGPESKKEGWIGNEGDNEV